jgi:nitric oxide reductase NorQ protein
MPPQQLNKNTTPEEIEAETDKYQEVLKQAGVVMKREQTIADMEKRVADMNGLTVEEWKRTFEVKAASAEAAPKPTKKKAVVRGAVTEVDRDYFYVEPKNQQIADTWMKLRLDMGIPQNMLVIGPSGCGKTELLQRLGREYGVPTYKIDCASITTPDKWVGHKELVTDENGHQITQYVKSQHLQWLGAEGDFEPGIVIYDEINRLPATMLNTLIPILDGSQKLWVPDLGIYQDVHPKTMIAATANLGVGYSGTHSMDIALQDRFSVTMEATFASEQEEISILVKRTGLDEARAAVLVKIARNLRGQADNNELSKYVSTRALLDAAVWVQAGMKIVDAASATFVKKFSAEGRGDSERAKVELAVSGIAGTL